MVHGRRKSDSAKTGYVPKRHEVPLIWDAALHYLDHELRRVMQATRTENYISPFARLGENFDCDEFSVHADYSDYSDDIDVEQPWNFKWRHVEINWYKRVGRAQTANVQLTPDMAAKMLNECIPAIKALET